MVSIDIKYLLPAMPTTGNGTAKSIPATTHALDFIPACEEASKLSPTTNQILFQFIFITWIFSGLYVITRILKKFFPVKSITGDETQYKKNPLFFSKVRLGMGNSHMSKPLPKQCTVMPKFGNNLQVRRFLFKRIKESILI